MKIILLCLALVLLSATAFSDVKFTPDEQRILDRGELSTARYIVGGVLASWPGFGIGHGVQGRYGEIGWAFTAGEVVGLGVALASITGCPNDTVGNGNCANNSGAVAGVVAGFVVYGGFRIWEVIDAWVVPPERNREYRKLRAREGVAGNPVSFTVVPMAENNLGLGLQYRF